MADDDKGTTSTDETFTRAQVRSMIAAEVRKVREQFADYDDLKTAAAEADKSKSAIERIEAKLDEATKRAEAAERETLIRDVAEHFGVSVRVARKFEGRTREELLADGRETLVDMGIEPDKSKRKASNTSTKDSEQDGNGTGGGNADEDGAGDEDEQQNDSGRNDGAASGEQQTTRQPRRPRENLRSGAPSGGSGRGDEALNPLELAAKVRR